MLTRFISSFLLIVLVAPSVMAKEEPKLSVGTYMGFYRPALEDLNQGEFQSPIAGEAQVINDQDELDTVEVVFPNPLPELGMGVNSGLEFQWRLNEKYTFLIGGGTWEATSRAVRSGGFYLQGEASDVINERAAKISYNEFYFGFRHDVLNLPKKYDVFYRLTLNEVFDIDYREDLVFLYTSGPAVGVKKTMVLQTQATGLLMLQPGFGFNYHLRDWLTIGMDAAYVVGLRRVTLRDGKQSFNFLSTDNLSLWLPQRLNPSTGNLEYLAANPEDRNDYTTMRLNFDGWKAHFTMKIHF